jgi:hypothetical protein
VARPPQQPAPPAPSAVRRFASTLADAALPAENPSGAIYGLIVIGALLAAESGRHESYLDTLLSATIAALLYCVAHAYAGLLAGRLRGGPRLTARSLLGALWRDATLIRGAAVPLLALLVAAIAGASQEAAVTVAVWSTIVSLAAFELLAALRSGAAGTELLLEVLLGVALAAGILALKIVLH